MSDPSELLGKTKEWLLLFILQRALKYHTSGSAFVPFLEITGQHIYSFSKSLGNHG